jgi:ABC-type glycerol-3-phosphate transport system substrate-binding protein
MRLKSKPFLFCLALVQSVVFGVAINCWSSTVRFMTTETDPPSVKVYEELIKQFEKQNPEIKVSLELTNSDDRRNKLMTGIATKSPPEVSQVMPEEVISLATKNELRVLDDVVDSIGKEDFLSGSLLPIHNHIYAIPYAGAASVLWVRTDLFQQKGLQYPTTWDELLNAAENLTMDTNGDGKTDIYGMAIPAGKNKWTGHNLTVFTLMAGGHLFDKDLNVVYDSPESVTALSFYAKLSKYAPPGIGSYSYYETIDAFVSGRVAMAPYMGRLLSHVATKAPDLEPYAKAVPFPRGKYKATYGTWDQYAVLSGSKFPEDGKKFLAFLSEPRHILKFSLTVPGHLVPPLKSIMEMPELYENPLIKRHLDDVKILFNAGSYGFSGTYEPGAYPDAEGVLQKSGIVNPHYNAIMTANVMELVVQKHLIANVPADEAVKWGANEMKRIVDEQKKR